MKAMWGRERARSGDMRFVHNVADWTKARERKRKRKRERRARERKKERTKENRERAPKRKFD